MRFIFDFDRTLFDTEAFMAAAQAYVNTPRWGTPAIWEIFDASAFIYDDVRSNLSQKLTETISILTAFSPDLGPAAFAFQVAKVERSGVKDLVGEVVVMEGDKGSYVAALSQPGPTVFVDDRIDHLLSAKAAAPEVMVVQMVRPGVGILPGHPSVLVISALAELDALIRLWKVESFEQ